MKTLIAALALLGLLYALVKYGIRRTLILDYERGLRYSKGKFIKILEPGLYWHSPLSTVIHKVDLRPRFLSITGQEILSADGVTLKISLAARYEIADLLAATNQSQDFEQALYLEVQLALREIVSAADIDTVLQSRSEFSKKLLELTEGKAQALGLKLLSAQIKDFTFPGKLKEIFAQVVAARKEGLAILEKARGETAALRNLANAAKLLEANPQLLQLRLLQSLGQSSGNSLVFGMPPAPPIAPTPPPPPHD
jgi:regulator of protease activity HflC (stomatin/prohibitin superfamily)